MHQFYGLLMILRHMEIYHDRWSTKGRYACPCCNMDTWLLNEGKFSYMGSRRFLPHDHSWRNNAKAFDGKKEKQSAPKPLSKDDIIEQYQHFDQVSIFNCLP